MRNNLNITQQSINNQLVLGNSTTDVSLPPHSKDSLGVHATFNWYNKNEWKIRW